MKKLALLLLVFTVNAYSQICLNCTKDTVLKRLKETDIVYNIQVHQDSIYCNTKEINSIGESYYLFKNDSCYKQVYVENIQDKDYFISKLNQLYCSQAFKNTWISYINRLNKSEIIRLVYLDKKIVITFELIDDI